MGRNWREYNEEPVKRGEILIDSSNFSPREEKAKKRERPYTYPWQLIWVLLFIKFALRLPYRQTEGLTRELFGSLGLKVPNFRTLHYRFTTSNFNLSDFPDPEELPDDFVIILDSTGVKVTNRGEWLRKKHGKKTRKGWIKLHVALDLKRKKVVAMKVTDERVHDSQKAKELIEKSKKKAEGKGKRVSKVIADAGYDTHEFFRYLGEEGIEPAVLVRKGAKIKGNPVRDRVIRQIRKGKKKWKEAVGYGKRWLIESFFSTFKRWFGEYVVSKRFDNMRKELVFMVGIMNTLMMAQVV
nr:IS5 family transposase [Hydrogenivirga caldilitoris]